RKGADSRAAAVRRKLFLNNDFWYDARIGDHLAQSLLNALLVCFIGLTPIGNGAGTEEVVPSRHWRSPGPPSCSPTLTRGLRARATPFFPTQPQRRRARLQKPPVLPLSPRGKPPP